MSEQVGVSPADIVRQREQGWPDFHPEDYCHRCGRPNVPSWWVDSDEWNRAVDGTDRAVLSILCPPCFVLAHEVATGEHYTWHLSIDPDTRTT